MSRYSRFFSLYHQAAKTEHWPYDGHGDLVADHTHGRTHSLRDLSTEELMAIERRIQELLDPNGDPANRMRRKVIGILAERGARLPNGKADMAHVHAWVAKYGYLHKHLNAYTVAELPKLVTQAEAITSSDIIAIRKHHG
ncbi:MAG: hypothetical protein JNL05_10410 [Flavobacteriales bacterium]|nr:hypothetical protein [Flavobacteriales bacterium]